MTTQDPANTLEPFRKYLRVLAELHLDRKLRGKLDPSDVVQQTMLRAYPALADLRRREPAVVTAWLRRILASTLADAARHYDRDRRDVALERSIEADLDRSASAFADWLAADHTSPSEHAERNEELLRMAAALAELPDPDARGGRPQALPGADPRPDRRADRPDRARRCLAVEARPGRVAKPPQDRRGLTRDSPAHPLDRPPRRPHRLLFTGCRGRRSPRPPRPHRLAPLAGRRPTCLLH